MKKTLFVLLVGVAAGYQIGWQDAHKHDESIVQRAIDKVQNAGKGRYNNDVDRQLERLEH